MWTAAALVSDFQTFSGEVWRMVESQANSATMRLTDSLAEQARLEELIDISKPPWPAECEGLDYLLATPFRYRPYPVGSRFRRAGQNEGVFYASEQVATAAAESAYYHCLFFAESPQARRPAAPVERTAFSVRISTRRGIDLPADVPDDYAACQDFADQARAAKSDAIRYVSRRCPRHGLNLALLTPAAFRDRKPRHIQTWHMLLSGDIVRAWSENPRQRLEFRSAT